MLRWPFALCAAVLALAVILGARVILSDDGTTQAQPLARSPDESRAAPGESTTSRSTQLELPSPLAVVANPSAPPKERASKPRQVLLLETVTLFDLGLHADEFALGERWQVGLGLTNAGSAFENDRVSCVEIPGGLQATLCDDGDGQSYRLTLGPGTHDLAPFAFSDRTSSVIVSRYGESADLGGPEDAVVLYEHRGADQLERGLAWRLDLPRGRDEWTFRASRGAFLDDQASTAWIPLGFELVLFAELEPYGLAVVLGPGLHELEHHGFNDRASSARVRRVR